MKKYVLISLFKLATNVEVNGENRVIEFKGGIRVPSFKPGYFRTSDKDLIKAIESSPSFNVKFKLAEEKETPKVEEEPKQIVVPETPVVVDEVTGWQGAKAYFVKTYPNDFDMTLNKAGVLEAAEKLNVQFPNWINK